MVEERMEVLPMTMRVGRAYSGLMSAHVLVGEP